MSSIEKKIIYVAGNPLILFHDQIFAGGRKCEVDRCELEPDEDGTSPETPSEDDGSGLVVANAQATAIDATFTIIGNKLKDVLMDKFKTSGAGDPLASSIIHDAYAIYDLARASTVDPRFARRFRSTVDRDLDDTGSLLEEISQLISAFRARTRMTVQLDHGGNLYHFLRSNDLEAEEQKKMREGERILGERLLNLGLIGRISRHQIKKALAGPNGMKVPLTMDLFIPQVQGLVSNHLLQSIFRLEEIELDPERVLHDLMLREASRLDLDDPDDWNLDDSGIPFHPIKSVFINEVIKDASDKPAKSRHSEIKTRLETKCLGIVAGLGVRLSALHDPGPIEIRMVMQRDPTKSRVTKDVIEAGLRVFREKWLTRNPSYQVTADCQMVVPTVVKSKS